MIIRSIGWYEIASDETVGDGLPMRSKEGIYTRWIYNGIGLIQWRLLYKQSANYPESLQF